MIIKGPLALGINHLREMTREKGNYRSKASRELQPYIEWYIFDVTKLLAEILDVSQHTITKLVKSDIKTELGFAVDSANVFTTDDLISSFRINTVDRMPFTGYDEPRTD